MLLEAALSFLGLGIQPPDASWGVLIREGANAMETYPWLLLYPGLFFSATSARAQHARRWFARRVRSQVDVAAVGVKKYFKAAE
jgi:ABC-type dipeptide/oligopeptide/nickel transport system permease subunit